MTGRNLLVENNGFNTAWKQSDSVNLHEVFLKVFVWKNHTSKFYSAWNLTSAISILSSWFMTKENMTII